MKAIQEQQEHRDYGILQAGKDEGCPSELQKEGSDG